MKLYLQNTLVLLPIFLFTIVVMGGHKLWADWRELTWRRDHVADSYAVSIAEFITPKRIAELKTAQTSSFGVHQTLQRIAQSDRIRRLSVFEAETWRPLFQTGDPPSIHEEDWLRAHRDDLAKLLESERESLSDEIHSLFDQIESETDPGTRPVLITASPVHDGFYHLNAVVLIESDISKLNTFFYQILLELTFITLMILLIAAIASLGLSLFVSRSIRDLTRAILDVQKGKLGTIQIPSPIREIDHLENTYNTMIDVLLEVKERDRDDLIRLNHAGAPNHLTEFYSRMIFSSIEYRNEDFVGLAALNGSFKGFFFDLHEKEQGLCGLIGQVDESGFDSVLSSSAIVALWRALLDTHEPSTALQMLLHACPLQKVKCCRIQPGNPAVIQIDTKNRDSTDVHHSQHKLNPGHSFFFHSFEGSEADTAELMIRWFDTLDPKHFAQRFLSAIDEKSQGAFVIVQSVLHTPK